jgi:hypothetical protein
MPLMVTDSPENADAERAMQARLFRAQWAVFLLSLGGAGLLGVLDMHSGIGVFLLLGIMAAYRVRCPRCEKAMMFSYGAARPRRTCPHCEWPKREG